MLAIEAQWFCARCRAGSDQFLIVSAMNLCRRTFWGTGWSDPGHLSWFCFLRLGKVLDLMSGSVFNPGCSRACWVTWTGTGLWSGSSSPASPWQWFCSLCRACWPAWSPRWYTTTRNPPTHTARWAGPVLIRSNPDDRIRPSTGNFYICDPVESPNRFKNSRRFWSPEPSRVEPGSTPGLEPSSHLHYVLTHWG